MTPGLRFRKTIRVAKGLRLNLSKSGTSVSVGGKGFTLNFSKRGVTRTVGLPGTGISVRQRLGEHKADDVAHHAHHEAEPRPPGAKVTVWPWIFFAALVMIAILIARH